MTDELGTTTAPDRLSKSGYDLTPIEGAAREKLAAKLSREERAILLDHGTVAAIGPSRDVIGRYLARGGGDSSWDLREWPQREGTGRAKIVKLEVLDATGSRLVSAVRFGEDFRLRIHFESSEPIASPAAGMSLLTLT